MTLVFLSHLDKEIEMERGRDEWIDEEDAQGRQD